MSRTITISLPDHLAALLDARRKAIQSPSDQDLIVQLLADALTREELEAELLKGVNGPAREITAAEWEAKRRAFVERHRRIA